MSNASASLHDIHTFEDVQQLVDSFYTTIRADDLLGPIFDDIAKVDWVAHLPKMYSFWETVLFARGNFKGNPLVKHLLLSNQTPLNQVHFDRWLSLWVQTVDGLFVGAYAEKAKQSAQSISRIMLHKIENRDPNGNPLFFAGQ